MTNVFTNINKYNSIEVKNSIETELVTSNNAIYNYSSIPVITVTSDDTCFLGNPIDICWKIEINDSDELNDDDKIDISYIQVSEIETFISGNLDPNDSKFTWNNTLNTGGYNIKFKVKYSDYDEVVGISDDVLVREVPNYEFYNLRDSISNNGKAIIDTTMSLYKDTDFLLKWETSDLVTIEYGIGYSSLFYPLSTVSETINNECIIKVPSINSKEIRIKIYNTKYPKYQYISDLITLKDKVLTILNDFNSLKLIGTHTYNINIYTEGIKAVKIIYSIDYEHWISIADNVLITNSNMTIEWIVPDISNEFTFIKLIEINNESNYFTSDSFRCLKKGEIRFIYPYKSISMPVDSETSIMFYACDVENIQIEFNSEPYMKGTWDTIYSGSIISDRITESNSDFCYHMHYYTGGQLSENYTLKLTNLDNNKSVSSKLLRIVYPDDFNSNIGTLNVNISTDIGICEHVSYKLTYRDHYNTEILVYETDNGPSLTPYPTMVSFDDLYSYDYTLKMHPINLFYEPASYNVGKPHINSNNIYKINRRKIPITSIKCTYLQNKYNNILGNGDDQNLIRRMLPFGYNLINRELGIEISDQHFNNNIFINLYRNQLYMGNWIIQPITFEGIDPYSYFMSNTSNETNFLSEYDIQITELEHSSITMYFNYIPWSIRDPLVPSKVIFQGNSFVGSTEIDFKPFFDTLFDPTVQNDPNGNNNNYNIIYTLEIIFTSTQWTQITSLNNNVTRVSNNTFEFKVSSYFPIINLKFIQSY